MGEKNLGGALLCVFPMVAAVPLPQAYTGRELSRDSHPALSYLFVSVSSAMETNACIK